MPLSMTDPRHWTECARHIYALVFETEKAFYINDTTISNPLKYYYEHYHERCPLTQEYVQRCKLRGEVPPMFLLERLIGTKADTFPWKVAWAKHIWEEMDYQCIVPALEPFIDECDSEEYHLIAWIPVNEETFAQDQEIYSRYLDPIRYPHCYEEDN